MFSKEEGVVAGRKVSCPILYHVHPILTFGLRRMGDDITSGVSRQFLSPAFFVRLGAYPRWLPGENNDIIKK
jgi:hypothetical protein